MARPTKFARSKRPPNQWPQVIDAIGGAEGDRTPDLMTASSSQAIFLNQNS
jgi:hypothetical protein